MATLADYIDAKYKIPSASVRFNGSKVYDILSIDQSKSLEDTLSSASLRTLTLQSIQPEARVTISEGYNGKESLTFTGFVDTIEFDEFERAYVITCRDVLKKAMDTFLVQEVAFGLDIDTGEYSYSTYSSDEGGTFKIHKYPDLSSLNSNHPETTGNYTNEGVKAEAVVQWLLHMSGLEEGTEIQVDDTNFFIGDISPAKFHLVSVYDAAMQIAQLIGWRIYADAAGVARFRRRPRSPSGFYQHKYTSRKEPYNILKVTRTDSNLDVRNYVEIRGASGIRYVARGDFPYSTNTPYRGVLISNELIDTPGMASFMGRRILNDLNRIKTTVSLETDGNPYLIPSASVNINAGVVNGTFLVEDIQTSMSADGGYKMTANASAYFGEVNPDEEPPADVVALFTAMQVVSLGDPKYIVTFNGGASYSNRGPIVRWLWNWPDGSVSDENDPEAFFVFDETNITSGNAQNVTLTVYDSLGNTATTTSGITLSGLLDNLDVRYRHLYGALTELAVGSLNGGNEWVVSSLPAISVAASNFMPGGIFTTSGFAIFGGSDGLVYRTNDCCVSFTTVLNAGSPVTDVHIPELDAGVALAGTESGKVFSSRDFAYSWTQIADFAFPIREVRHAYQDTQYVLVVGSGHGNIYESFNLGHSWNKLATDIDANRESSGSLTNYFAHTSGILGAGPNGANGISFTGGGSPNVKAISIMIDRDDGVMAVDSTGQHWVGYSGIMNQTQNNTLNLTRHMLRDGELPMLVYYATQSGISKSLDRNTSIAELFYPTSTMPEDGWGMMVAYGPLSGPIPPPGRLVYRGSVFEPDFGEKFGGFFASSINNDRWLPGCADPGGDVCVPGPGFLALGGGTGENVHMIKLVPSGASFSGQINLLGGVAYLTLFPDYITLNDHEVRSLAVSRSPTQRRDLYVLAREDVANGDVKQFAFNDVLNTHINRDHGELTARIFDVNDSDFNIKPTYVASTAEEVVTSVQIGLFAGRDNVTSVGFKSGDVITKIFSDPDPGDLKVWYAPFCKFPQRFSGLVYITHLDSESVLTSGWYYAPGPSFFDNLSLLEPINIPMEEVIRADDNNPEVADTYKFVFESVTNPSTLYYATAAGVYTIPAYGRGQSEQIYTSSGGLFWMCVTHDAYNRYDYVTVAEHHPTIDGRDIVRYSLDGGETWTIGPDIRHPAGGSFGGLWYVDSLPASGFLLF